MYRYFLYNYFSRITPPGESYLVSNIEWAEKLLSSNSQNSFLGKVIQKMPVHTNYRSVAEQINFRHIIFANHRRRRYPKNTLFYINCNNCTDLPLHGHYIGIPNILAGNGQKCDAAVFSRVPHKLHVHPHLQGCCYYRCELSIHCPPLSIDG